jgi:hypothetical protein
MTTAPQPFKLVQVGAKFPPQQTMAWVARTYGVSRGRQFREMARLALPPHLLSADDYLRHALFRPALDWAQKAAFVSGYSGSNLNYRLSPRKTWMQVVLGYKHRTLWMLKGAGLPVPEVRAAYSPDGPLPGALPLADAAAIAGWLRVPGNLPCFGKPFAGTFSIGGVKIEALEDGLLRLGDGNRLTPEDFAAAVVRHFAGGYLFQPVLRMHPVLQPFCDVSISSLRVVTLWEADGPRALYTAAKLPGPGNMTDGPMPGQANTMVAVDMQGGQYLRAQYNAYMNDRTTDIAPANGLPLAGLTLPDFRAAVDLACTAHRMFPPHGILGTDVILTPEGPLINEINPNPTHTLYQRSFDRGLLNPDFRPRFDEAARLVRERIARPSR